MLSLEQKKRESEKIKIQAKELSEKLARKYAEEYFHERIASVTPVDETRKQELINRITLQYQPYYYKDIINKVISQKVMEEQQLLLQQQKTQYQQNNAKKESNVNTTEIDRSVLETSKNISNIMRENDNQETPEQIANNINNIVMNVLDK